MSTAQCNYFRGNLPIMTDEELRAAVDAMVDERKEELAQARADANLYGMGAVLVASDGSARVIEPGAFYAMPEESQSNAGPE
jgi:hypothetical protein